MLFIVLVLVLYTHTYYMVYIDRVGTKSSTSEQVLVKPTHHFLAQIRLRWLHMKAVPRSLYYAHAHKAANLLGLLCEVLLGRAHADLHAHQATPCKAHSSTAHTCTLPIHVCRI
jgi:hypothetical protein